MSDVRLRRISRRTFLQGAGAALALPFFESLLPKPLWAAPPPPPKRFVGFYVPCGIHMAGWTPVLDDANYQLTPILQPLAALKPKFSVLTGLANRPARPDGPGDHGWRVEGRRWCLTRLLHCQFVSPLPLPTPTPPPAGPGWGGEFASD